MRSVLCGTALRSPLGGFGRVQLDGVLADILTPSGRWRVPASAFAGGGGKGKDGAGGAVEGGAGGKMGGGGRRAEEGGKGGEGGRAAVADGSPGG